MGPFDDNWHVTPRRRIDDRTADALLSGRAVEGEPELSALVGQLRSLADLPAPAPSAALAAMLENGLDPASQALDAATPAPPMAYPAAVSWRTRTRALPLQLSLAGTAGLALVLGAAAAGALPAPAQTAVADVVEAVTPLHLPRPAAHPAPDVVPTPTGAPEAGNDQGDASPGPGGANDSGGRRGTDEHQGQPSRSPVYEHSSRGDQPRVGANPAESQSPGDGQHRGNDSGSSSGATSSGATSGGGTSGGSVSGAPGSSGSGTSGGGSDGGSSGG